MKDGWRPIAVETPTPYRTVLVSAAGAAVDQVISAYFDGEIWVDGGGYKLKGITHWMPSPMPPESGQP